MRAVDYVGSRFGRLVAIKKIKIRPGKFKYLCRCDCGKMKEISYFNLKKGNTKSCGCLKKEVLSRLKRKSDFDVVVNSMHAYYKRNAKLRTPVEFLLTKEEFVSLIQKPCFYCGSVGSKYWSNKYHTHSEIIANGIDRMDNTRGYVLENCVPCCKRCNTAKNDMTLEEFVIWIKRVYKRNCQ